VLSTLLKVPFLVYEKKDKMQKNNTVLFHHLFIIHLSQLYNVINLNENYLKQIFLLIWRKGLITSSKLKIYITPLILLSLAKIQSILPIFPAEFHQPSFFLWLHFLETGNFWPRPFFNRRSLRSYILYILVLVSNLLNKSSIYKLENNLVYHKKDKVKNFSLKIKDLG
jgi:hypothetical protein